MHFTTIPAGDIVKAVADPSDEARMVKGDGARMVKVLWKGRMFVMFAGDLKQRAIESTKLRPRESAARKSA